MLKIHYKIGALFILVLLFCALYWSLSIQEQDIKPIAECDLSKQACHITLHEKSLNIHFSALPIVLEELNELVISSDEEHLQILDGRIEGISMNMGHIPLQFKPTRFNQTTNQWRANVVLGACTDPLMTWLLTVNVQLNGLPYTIPLIFNTELSNL
ncbi:hypothetical protein C2869_13205 [Saccharobesus litoralis]|uniref:Uncharacterized protein n=1 Tax=Saccharobesus litoralis TaxID=2172099 RepID=A0A2S0VT01_9ALTE|nr:hypothetical protein [Saccharobesus litoralis]AWB67339.1 hypothetical protein C2869_13205 [Saccharobesus litoralis]